MGLAGERSRILPQPEMADGSFESKRYRLYSARWLVLAVCCLLSLSNSMLWLSFITLSEQTAEFYCKDSECSAAFLTNQIFQLVAVVTGIGGMYITDNCGIRLSVSFLMYPSSLDIPPELCQWFTEGPNYQNVEAEKN
ncbi:unnamed protein product [Nippostrongylus brasiliensis]|uniref:CASP-like protein n=1 Tax=Nippostrongylus brasiliensis TaxID=27835 RepID=A0A0N4Y309_NIPBR|nr:unnamed protein product [Nippostrongylus brasiliensis]